MSINSTQKISKLWYCQATASKRRRPLLHPTTSMNVSDMILSERRYTLSERRYTTKEDILYNSTYMKFKNRSDWKVLSLVRKQQRTWPQVQGMHLMLIWVVVTWMYTSINTCQSFSLRFMCSAVYKLSLKKKKRGKAKWNFPGWNKQEGLKDPSAEPLPTTCYIHPSLGEP